MNKRELTGNWYLSRRTFGGFDVMVEVVTRRWDDSSYGNGGGGYAPAITKYQVAKERDLIDLGINCLK